jgi:hypothetical protein
VLPRVDHTTIARSALANNALSAIAASRDGGALNSSSGAEFSAPGWPLNRSAFASSAARRRETSQIDPPQAGTGYFAV